MDKVNMVKKLPHIIKKTIKKLLRPICYSYTGYKVFDFINRLTGYKKERQKFFSSLGYYPNLKNPQSFNEKVIWKKIYDRNPLLPIVSDKYKVREYLKEVLGEKEAEKILIPLLYVTNNPENIPFDTLQEEYIIKPNHASGMILLAENIEKQKRYTIIDDHKTTILSDCNQTRSKIIKICKRWISMPYGFSSNEWAYQKIKRKIVIEKLLRDNCGKIPADYKFHMFYGKCKFIYVCSGRYGNFTLTYYDTNWNSLNVSYDKPIKPTKKPDVLDKMILISEKLSKDFDYVRIDLYITDNNIYFGEITQYPDSGHRKFTPTEFDFKLGKYWKIK
ncbi:MAG: hypothetical protein M1409_07940 [Actinobacteria bacterium]|nr:hypothetical protein [Actinomycetota bacterium]